MARRLVPIYMPTGYFGLSEQEVHEIIEDEFFAYLKDLGWYPRRVTIEEAYHGMFIHQDEVVQIQWNHDRFGTGSPSFTTREAMNWERENG